MANTHRPKTGKRRLVMSTVHSILLYGTDSLTIIKYCHMSTEAAGAEDRMLLPVSISATLVVTGVDPIDLLAIERKRIYRNSSDKRR